MILSQTTTVGAAYGPCRLFDGKQGHYQDAAAHELYERGAELLPHMWVTPSCGTSNCLEHLRVNQPRSINYPPGVCVYCGLVADTKDHLIPETWSGTSMRRFVATVPACTECNECAQNGAAHTGGSERARPEPSGLRQARTGAERGHRSAAQVARRPGLRPACVSALRHRGPIPVGVDLMTNEHASSEVKDSSEALRGALVEWFESHLTFDAADALLPRVVAYGDQRAAEAQHDACDDARLNGDPDVAAWIANYIKTVEHPDNCPECAHEQAPLAPKHVHAWTQSGSALSCACGGTARVDLGTPQPPEAEDGSEALRERLANAALHARVPTAPAWGDLDGYVRDVWRSHVAGVVDEALAYGREQRHQGAEGALRDAAGSIAFTWLGAGSARDWLTARADEIGRQA